MKGEKIALDEWRALYLLAMKYKELGCWEWMEDLNVFGVENVDTHEMGYCCIMGSKSGISGIVFYIGDEGLKSYFQTLHPTIPVEDIGFIQSCITLYFNNRDDLSREDLRIIKELGLKFRGKNEWPKFRNFTPNYYPCGLSREEVKYMTYAIEQAIEVVMRCKKSKQILHKGEDLILARVAGHKNDKLVWRDKYLSTKLEKEELDTNVNEIALRKITDKKFRKSFTWEVDVFNAPVVIKEKGRPYYPLMLMVVEAESGRMLDMKMSSDFESYMDVFRNEFAGTIMENRCLPSMIVVQRENVLEMLTPVAEKLGIQICLVDELYNVQDFRMGLQEFL